MNKYEDRIRKNKIIRRRNRVVMVAFLVIVFSWAFFIGTKLASRKTSLLSSSNIVGEGKSTKQNSEVAKDTLHKRFTTSQPPGEYKPWKVKRKDGKKVAYLTFDDGPSPNNTPQVLKILKENDIKATFFLIGKNAGANKDLVKQEVKEGHVVANHTYSHKLGYREDPSAFVDDVNRCDLILKAILGRDYNLKLLRFPGGSFNTASLNMEPFKKAITEEGYHYVDWNDWIGDASGNDLPVWNLMNELKKYTTNDTVVILMHDAAAKTTTVRALPEVIQYLKSNGYTFETLN
ncbi:polysaccharide deacetylase family protein [Clostridium sp. WILCCON 0269]|uniref:Polysaccharide deacetylase family protein n=1 Tax=Candidatus Clostridium eludens TaxID=3381663 RepID=A0ABW8SND8_9CLOT